MNDLRDIFIGFLGSGLWAILALLVIQLFVRLQLHARSGAQDASSSSVARHLFDGFTWMVRRICGMGAFAVLGFYVEVVWFRRFVVWEHFFGWSLLVLATIVISVAYLVDPWPGSPKRSVKWNTTVRRIQNTVHALMVVVLLVLTVYSTYLDAGDIALRHRMVHAERAVAESKVMLAEMKAGHVSSDETLRKVKAIAKQLEDDAASESAVTLPSRRSASVK